MSRIPDADISRINADTDLVALIQSRGVPLKQHGQAWSGPCPFHDENEHPNLIVTPSNGLWRCTATDCGRTGNAIQFLESFDGLSFRHAFELLAHGGKAAYECPPGAPRKQTTVPRLPCPLDETAPDEILLGQVAAYYASRLAAPESQSARDYLVSRGLYDETLWQRFGIGYSDRTLGLRIPEKNRKQGAELRERLQGLGVYRNTGREHLNGCITIPICECWPNGQTSGHIAQIYGRRSDPKVPKQVCHIYLEKPAGGIFNPAALAHREIILAESLFDALTFIQYGSEAGLPLMAATTCTHGPGGFSDALFEAIRSANISSIKLAFGSDNTGELAAADVAARLQAIGIECHRVRFPWGMDANTFALDHGGEALSHAVRSAEWLGKRGGRIHTASPSSGNPVSPSAIPYPTTYIPASSSLAGQGGWASQPTRDLQAHPPVVAELTNFQTAFHPETAVPEKTGQSFAALTPHGDAWQLMLSDRLYRITGLDKNNSPESIKITLRLTEPGGLFHLDALDLCRDTERRRFVERAAEETCLTKDLIKRDLGKLLLSLEMLQQSQRLAAAAAEATRHSAVILAPTARAAALELLRSPDLLERITLAFDAAGTVGEANNKLAAYLACTSRLMDKPLGVLIQSTSAAGKSTLMDAVLAFFPPESRVKYSAMTGQSLYYLAEGNLRHKILAIVEEKGAEKARYALKLLQSEQELTIASTGKDPRSGRMETQEYHVEGPVAILFTTTAIDIDEELMNRCLVLTVDESREQTERIHALQREARTIDGLRLKRRRAETIELFQNAQRLLEPVAVVNPFAGQLRFTSGRTRTRRDHEKYLTLIDSITLLHQHQRPLHHDTVAGPHIRTTLDDIAAANRLAPEILGRSLDEIPPQTRHLLEHIKIHVRTMMDRDRLDQRQCHFTRRDIREASCWSEFQVRMHLARLEQLEHIQRRSGRNGMLMKYELLVDATEPACLWHVGLLDVSELSMQPQNP
ncbi:MAG: CHC2 zinc finger domain-containing protein [Verrucomicrobiota bacterium]